MPESLYVRDGRAVADIVKLRFFPLSIVGGKGNYLIEENGRRLLDLSATWGAASLGYSHPAVVEAVEEAIRNQAGASILSGINRPAVELAEMLLSVVPGKGQRRIWIGHSGSDANEAALRSILVATGRPRVISFVGAYHGGTAGSMSISGHTSQSDTPKMPGALFLPYPNPYRPYKGDPTGQAVLELLDRHLHTDCPADEVAAFFVEPIMSDGGLIVPPPGFLKALHDRLQPFGVHTVCDEVKVGMGRSGRMHCFEHEDFTPDVVTLGKGLGGGLPLSAVVGPADTLDIASAFAMETTCGNPVSASAGLAVLRTIQEERLPQKAAATGKAFMKGLNEMAARHPLIGDVRGRGLVLGVELVRDRQSREPASMEAAKVAYRAYELGAVLYYVGLESNVLELTPPLTLKEAEMQSALDIIQAAIDDVENDRVPDSAIQDFAGW
jgi:4-aminobutyrate aminotransferase